MNKFGGKLTPKSVVSLESVLIAKFIRIEESVRNAFAAASRSFRVDFDRYSATFVSSKVVSHPLHVKFNPWSINICKARSMAVVVIDA